MARKQRPAELRDPTQHLADLIGHRIRSFRLERRGPPIVQSEIADRANISVSFLSMIERGERSASLETLAAIADALGVSLAELFSAEGLQTQSTTSFHQLVSYLQRRRISRRQVSQLLTVAKAMFSD